MLARTLRWTLALQWLTAALAAAAFGSPQSKGQTVALAALVLLTPVLVKVLATVYSTLASRPHGSAWALWWRALWGEAWATVWFFVLTQPWTWQRRSLHWFGATPLDSPRVPVVLVHGYLCNHRLWDRVAGALRQRGHAVVAVDLEPVFAPIDSYAPRIEQAVQALCTVTGAAQVALVGHSMGGLAIRAWMRAHGSERAAKVLSLGSPHAGTQVLQPLRTPNGEQMRWHSAWLRALAESEPPALRQRMEIALSTHDNIVFPQREQVLSGVPVTVFEGLGHLQMCRDAGVVQWVAQRLGEVRPL
ncbi:MAG: esterase/lipase family protein [Rhodoferax sp.]